MVFVAEGLAAFRSNLLAHIHRTGDASNISALVRDYVTSRPSANKRSVKATLSLCIVWENIGKVYNSSTLS